MVSIRAFVKRVRHSSATAASVIASTCMRLSILSIIFTRARFKLKSYYYRNCLLLLYNINRNDETPAGKEEGSGTPQTCQGALPPIPLFSTAMMPFLLKKYICV